MEIGVEVVDVAAAAPALFVDVVVLSVGFVGVEAAAPLVVDVLEVDYPVAGVVVLFEVVALCLGILFSRAIFASVIFFNSPSSGTNSSSKAVDAFFKGPILVCNSFLVLLCSSLRILSSSS